jgi:hypothetical protein
MNKPTASKISTRKFVGNPHRWSTKLPMKDSRRGAIAKAASLFASTLAL